MASIKSPIATRFDAEPAYPAAATRAAARIHGDGGEDDDEGEAKCPQRPSPADETRSVQCRGGYGHARGDEHGDARSLPARIVTRVNRGHHATPPPSARRRSAVSFGRLAPARAALAWTAPSAVRR